MLDTLPKSIQGKKKTEIRRKKRKTKSRYFQKDINIKLCKPNLSLM